MRFIIDKQTMDDLEILGKYKPHSVFSLYNTVLTGGGEQLLENMFRSPLTGADEINKRLGIFQFFSRRSESFPCDPPSLTIAENYLSSQAPASRVLNTMSILRKRAAGLLGMREEYLFIEQGLRATIGVLNQLAEYLEKVGRNDSFPDQEFIKQAEWLHSPSLVRIRKEAGVEKWSLLKWVALDNALRVNLRKEMMELLQFIYRIDIYIAVASLAVRKGFCFPVAGNKESRGLRLTNCFHPSIADPVTNSLSMDTGRNVIFLTGANMAGKSTLMKTIGIALYLAHMGFPVPAAGMEFPVRDGMFTSINVADDLQRGYSHFYAEVRRVKTIAEHVAEGKDLLVIFDELFKGTNVKDAYDATFAVMKEFAGYKCSFFVMSTHITEVGEMLKPLCPNFQFLRLPTILDESRPRYTYQLEPGISEDRHGMMIIQREKIIEIIEGNP